jgi:anti-anti-sigma regulatory factor
VKVERDGTGVCRLTVVTDPIWDAFGFSRLITSALQDDDRVVEIDLLHIPCLHSPGLANLVAIYVHAQKRGKSVRLVNVSAQNLKVLRATQLDQLFG